jgi:ethanolaminephosphotransferase
MIQLSEASNQAIICYRYHGGDSSPIYQNILSPFAQFCVETFVPLWVAPNVITLTGLVATSTTAILALYYNPNLSVQCPPWLYLMSAISIFFYQTLDNMDGKQARRTNSSTALGMLFDHTCDVFNAVVISILMSSAFGTGWSCKIFLCFLCGYIPFFFQTWEEFHVGSMILPVFNGPTEGLLMSVGICLISYINGSAEWWQQPFEVTLFGEEEEFTPFSITFIFAIFIVQTTIGSQILKG